MKQKFINHIKPIGFKIWENTSITDMGNAHSHGDIEINFLGNGFLDYMHGGRIFPLTAQRINIFWGGIPHQTVKKSREIHGVWLTLPVQWFIRWKLPGGFLNRLLAGEMILDENPREEDWQHLLNWVDDFKKNSEEYCKIILLELEARLRRIALSSPNSEKSNSLEPVFSNKQFMKTLDFIADNFLKIKNIDGLAKKVNLHPKYLMQLFKKTSGINLWEYILRLRIAHAQRLLLTSDMKVLDISYEAGFDSSSAFYKSFEKYSLGLTPANYKKHILN